jgi:hypothetical protein
MTWLKTGRQSIQINFGVVDEHHLLCDRPTHVLANDVKRIDVSLPVELVV